MPIAIMRVTQLRQADLNLLIVFTVLAEERNEERASRPSLGAKIALLLPPFNPVPFNNG